MPYVIKPDREGDGFVTEGIAGEKLDKYDLVFLSGGKWFKASAGAYDTLPAYGLALSEIRLGLRGKILLYGLVSNLDWAWNDGLIYASTVAGELTQTAPPIPGWTQCVGVAHGSDYLLFAPLWIKEMSVAPSGGLVNKSGIVNTGGSSEATVSFNTNYPDTDYFIMLTAGGDPDATIVNVKTGFKSISGFTVVSMDDSGRAEPNVDVYWATGPYSNP